MKPYIDRAEFMKSVEWLPQFMRDFHDQKDLFKTIEQLWPLPPPHDNFSWVAAHIYTIDRFLWVMALHGYTLQRCRKRVQFRDIYGTIRDAYEARSQQMASLLNSVHDQAQEAATKEPS